MEQLPNNCRVGKISIHPKNWDSKKISREDMLSEWYIKYRFYDDNAHKEKQVVIKSGVNEFKTLADKQSAIRDLLRIERNELKNGYNPIVNPTECIPRNMGVKISGFSRHIPENGAETS